VACADSLGLSESIDRMEPNRLAARGAAALRANPYVGTMLIDGQLCESAAGWTDCVNPADESIVGRVPLGTVDDVARAVSAAQAAQPGWAGLTVAARAAHMNRLADAIAAHADELLLLEVADSGNSITGMEGDIASSVERLRYFAGLGYELQGSTIPGSDDRLSLTLREPYGVVGRIAAFNHPIAMAVNGIAAALMAGNTLVLKPSEQCSLSSTMLGSLSREALPPGVLNVVTGGAEVGSALVRHPRVKRLSFVGSEPTGRAIQRNAAEVAVKAVSLELGGKNPFIVFPDAPLDKVVDAAVLGEPAAGARQPVRRSGAARGGQSARDPHRRPVRPVDTNGRDHLARAARQGGALRRPWLEGGCEADRRRPAPGRHGLRARLLV
jgi:betaine-aldehyde dehydrogenase